MAVLPENMDKLDVENVPGSLSIIQEYIRYMGERIEFSFRNMTRTVSNAGISSTELYILMQAQAQQLAALSSVVSGAIGDITSLQHDVADLKADVSSADRETHRASGGSCRNAGGAFRSGRPRDCAGEPGACTIITYNRNGGKLTWQFPNMIRVIPG